MKNPKNVQQQPPNQRQPRVTELTDEQLEQVQGGLNPPPLPPGSPILIINHYPPNPVGGNSTPRGI